MSTELTRRQRQVIEMIAAGRTNPEIAGALGITLAGAKWHVSEVLARLGVASREEAAEAWGERQRARAQVGRAMRALASWMTWKVAAGGAAALLVVGAVAAGFATFRGDEEDRGAAAAGTTMTEDEARAHAVYAAGEYLRTTDIPQRTSVNGHALGMSDLELVELVFTPAGGTVSSYYNGSIRYEDGSGTAVDEATWTATFRRENVPMPDMGWSDGVVQVTVAFRDASGTVSSASAGSRSKAMEVLPAPPYSPPDRSGYNRVGPFIEVLRFGTVESERTLSVFERADGGWSLTDASTESGAGSTVPLGGPTRESPHLFGVSVVGADFRNGPNVPGRVSGISVDPVATVRVQFENGGAALEVTPTRFPAETGLSWKAFAVEFAADAGPVAAVLAVDAEGRELSRYEPPRTVEVPPYVVEPLAPIAFSGTGDAVGGAFELPPPAFPATVALEIEHAGPAAVTVVCGAARIPVLSPDGSAAAPVTRLEGSTYHVTLSPRATACSFEVESAGAWEIRSP